MREFFRGWRRKVGGFALVMACVFTGMWVRSYVVCDAVGHFDAAGDLRQLTSVSGWLVLLYSPYQGDPPPPLAVWAWDTIAADSFRGGAGCSDEELPIPYLLLALPTTLISAYLILWKPKQNAATANNAEALHA